LALMICSITGMFAPLTICPSMRKRGVPVPGAGHSDPVADLHVGLQEVAASPLLQGVNFISSSFPVIASS
jgi:hypothetical protein